jgi:hypothetical protein
MNTAESNRLIAEFMGQDFYAPNEFKYEVEHGAKFFTPDKMQYRKNWSWLMPVVVKINHMDGGRYSTVIETNRCKIKDEKYGYPETGEKELIVSESRATMHEAVFDAVVNFIIWYNEQKK